MKIEEFTHYSTDGIHNIYVKAHIPDCHPKAVIHIIHGVAEHIGRYDDFAREMCKRGYLVYGADLLGHGRSISSEDEICYFAEKDGWMTVCRDIKLLSEIMRARYPATFYLFGHSMGSFLARTIYYKRLFPIDGLILSGSGTMSLLKIKAARFIAKREYKKLANKKGSSKLINSLAFGGYNKRVSKNPRTKSDWISSDRDEVDKYIADPLCGADASVSLFLDMLDGLEFINTNSNAQKVKKTIPVFIASGTKDPVGDMGKGPQKIKKVLKAAGVKSVRLRLYDGMHHEILHDRSKNAFIDDLDQWMRVLSDREKEKSRSTSGQG